MEVEAMAVPAEQQRKVWSSKQIFFAAGFGGVLGGLYLLSENYKALGHLQLAKKTLIAALISSILALTAIFFTPDESIGLFAPFLILAQCILVGGYIIGEHSKSFYNKSYTKQVLIYVPVLTLMILALPFYLSETLTAHIPRFICALIPGISFQSIAQFYQDEQVKNLIKTGFKKGSILKLLGITSLAILIQLGMVFMFAIAIDVLTT